MASKVAWFTKTSRASLATAASQAPVLMPASPAVVIAGARALGSLAATVMALHCCWIHCSIICDWSAALASVGPSYTSSMSSSPATPALRRLLAYAAGRNDQGQGHQQNRTGTLRSPHRSRHVLSSFSVHVI